MEHPVLDTIRQTAALFVGSLERTGAFAMILFCRVVEVTRRPVLHTIGQTAALFVGSLERTGAVKTI